MTTMFILQLSIIKNMHLISLFLIGPNAIVMHPRDSDPNKRLAKFWRSNGIPEEFCICFSRTQEIDAGRETVDAHKKFGDKPI